MSQVKYLQNSEKCCDDSGSFILKYNFYIIADNKDNQNFSLNISQIPSLTIELVALELLFLDSVCANLAPSFLIVLYLFLQVTRANAIRACRDTFVFYTTG